MTARSRRAQARSSGVRTAAPVMLAKPIETRYQFSCQASSEQLFPASKRVIL